MRVWHPQRNGVEADAQRRTWVVRGPPGSGSAGMHPFAGGDPITRRYAFERTFSPEASPRRRCRVAAPPPRSSRTGSATNCSGLLRIAGCVLKYGS